MPLITLCGDVYNNDNVNNEDIYGNLYLFTIFVQTPKRNKDIEKQLEKKKTRLDVFDGLKKKKIINDHTLQTLTHSRVLLFVIRKPNLTIYIYVYTNKKNDSSIWNEKLIESEVKMMCVRNSKFITPALKLYGTTITDHYYLWTYENNYQWSIMMLYSISNVFGTLQLFQFANLITIIFSYVNSFQP